MTDIGYETGLFWGLASGGERSGAAKRRHEEQGARQKPADRTRCGYRFWFAGAREWPNDRGSRGKAAGREMNGYVGLGAGGLATALDQPHVHHVANAGPALGVELIDSIDGYVLRPGRSLDFTRPAPIARISLSSRTAVRGLRRRGVRGSGRREENSRYQIHAEFSSLPPDHIRFIPISDSFQYPFRSTARFVLRFFPAQQIGRGYHFSAWPSSAADRPRIRSHPIESEVTTSRSFVSAAMRWRVWMLLAISAEFRQANRWRRIYQRGFSEVD